MKAFFDDGHLQLSTTSLVSVIFRKHPQSKAYDYMYTASTIEGMWLYVHSISRGTELIRDREHTERCLDHGLTRSLTASVPWTHVSYISRITEAERLSMTSGCLSLWCPCILYGKTQRRKAGNEDPSLCNSSVQTPLLDPHPSESYSL